MTCRRKSEALRHAIGQWIFFLDADMALPTARRKFARQLSRARLAPARQHPVLADGVTEDV